MEEKVHDGGLCLLAPFLSNLFKYLLVTSDNNFANEKQKIKAYTLLLYLVSGSIEYKKNTSNLSYYIAAMPTLNFDEDMQLSEKEIKECNMLLQTVISLIPNLQQLSIETFQKDFLQREGLYNIHTNQLIIERKSIDIILDSVPWNFNTIKLPWMRNIFKVEW